jgi:hypothetical protein
MVRAENNACQGKRPHRYSHSPGGGRGVGNARGGKPAQMLVLCMAELEGCYATNTEQRSEHSSCVCWYSLALAAAPGE